MNRIAAILPFENILLDVDCSSKKRIFEYLGLFFENQWGFPASTVSDHLFARERLGSTGLGRGVAIPHGRIKALKHPIAAFMRLQNPIGFDAPDDQPVHLIFALLVPEVATQAHLEILSEVAELLSDVQLRTLLSTSSHATEVHQLIKDWAPATLPQE